MRLLLLYGQGAIQFVQQAGGGIIRLQAQARMVDVLGEPHLANLTLALRQVKADALTP